MFAAFQGRGKEEEIMIIREGGGGEGKERGGSSGEDKGVRIFRKM